MKVSTLFRYLVGIGLLATALSGPVLYCIAVQYCPDWMLSEKMNGKTLDLVHNRQSYPLVLSTGFFMVAFAISGLTFLCGREQGGDK